jgi:bifunctional enzyme CysN/CysC
MSHQSSLIASDINAYLEQHENKELLRFITCGSVDDGKSTLIGRLLHDSKMIYEDQLAAINKESKRVGTTGDQPDLALLVDGLQAEREQGITIDVAYRYFSTAKRKFIIADTPGHEQYTRNMATGASTADLAIILVDARYGVQTQTRRHSYIVSLLGIKHIVVAINKMDLVEFDQNRFNEIQVEYLALADKLGLKDIHFCPISALQGDNVVDPSVNTPWYQGSTLMELLEVVDTGRATSESFRYPVQYVSRPNLNFRGYAGTIASGSIEVGQRVKVLPSNKQSTVKSIVTMDGNLERAFAPMAVTLTLNDEIDISRGDTLVLSNDEVEPIYAFRAKLIWMDQSPLKVGNNLLIKTSAAKSTGRISEIYFKVDVNSQESLPADSLSLNEIAEVSLQLDRAIQMDPYQVNGATGSFVVIDRLTNRTIAAGMMVDAEQPIENNEIHSETAVDETLRSRRLGHKALIVGLPNISNSVLYTLEKRLFDRGLLPAVSTRTEDAALLKEAGLIVLSTIESGSDLVIGAQANSKVYLDITLPTEKQVDLILQSLTELKLL